MQTESQNLENFGCGLNSLRTRFSILVFVLALLVAGSALGALHWFMPAGLTSLPISAYGVIALSVVLAVFAVFFVAGMLASQIRELTLDASRIAAGDLETKIAIERDCEIGGLANGMRQMLSSLRGNIEEIRDLAMFDTLTGLPNRHHLMTCLNARFSSAAAEDDHKGSIFYLDLNGFKKVNDTFGHGVGDKLLRAVSERILEGALGFSMEDNRTCAMDRDTRCRLPVLARFGGDEFVLHVPDLMMKAELGRIAKQLLLAVTRPFDIDGQLIGISTAVGIASYPTDGDNTEMLVRHADLAMYSAKQSNSGNICFFDPSLVESPAEQSEGATYLKKSVQKSRLEVCNHPKLRAQPAEMPGIETRGEVKLRIAS